MSNLNVKSLARPLVLSLVVAAVVLAAAAVIAVVGQKRTDRIVDCAPGYRNVAGPASDCVPIK